MAYQRAGFWACLTILSLIGVANGGQSMPGSAVIDLDKDNFEHLTQASTGATTGDWLIKVANFHCSTVSIDF